MSDEKTFYIIRPEQPNSRGQYVLKKCYFGPVKKETVIAKFFSKEACDIYAKDYMKHYKDQL